MQRLFNTLEITRQSLVISRLFSARAIIVLVFLTLFTSVEFIGVVAANQPPAPADEPGILHNGKPVHLSADLSALAGTWGKCLKSVDTRCYFMSLAPEGAASILTYISSRDKQFGEDPAEKPHCYSATERRLVKLGSHTYAWEDILASRATVDPDRLMKIVILDNALLVYSGDKLQLSLPSVGAADRQKLIVCE